MFWLSLMMSGLLNNIAMEFNRAFLVLEEQPHHATHENVTAEIEFFSQQVPEKVKVFGEIKAGIPVRTDYGDGDQSAISMCDLVKLINRKNPDFAVDDLWKEGCNGN